MKREKCDPPSGLVGANQNSGGSAAVPAAGGGGVSPPVLAATGTVPEPAAGDGCATGHRACQIPLPPFHRNQRRTGWFAQNAENTRLTSVVAVKLMARFGNPTVRFLELIARFRDPIVRLLSLVPQLFVRIVRLPNPVARWANPVFRFFEATLRFLDPMGR